MGLNNLLVIMVMMVVFLLEGWGSDGCLEQERIALLQIKASFNYPNGTSLSSWGQDADCCNWKYVSCNSDTGHVTQIYLSDIRDWSLGDFYLNASLFLSFQELNSLYLSGNHIVGCVENQGFEKLSRLGNLETLYLDENSFSNNILSSLGGLTSLKSLFLNNNTLKGTIYFEELNNLTSLKELRMDGNEIEGFKSLNGHQDLLQLSNLELLYLSDNHLDNNILSSLKGLSSLKSLHIDGNLLRGSVNMEELNNLTSLMELHMDGNEIEGFKSLYGLRFGNLDSLDLSHNQFDNKIMSSLRNLSSLKYLKLQNNQLKGSINMKELDGLSNLELLDLSINEINNFVFSKDTRSLRNLSTLHLDSITTNERTFHIQSTGYLKILYLTENNFKGAIFAQDLRNFTVEEIYLDKSSLDQDSLQSIVALPSLKIMHMNNGIISDIDPTRGFPNLKNLEELDLDSSRISSSFLQTIGRFTSLKTLILSGCGLNGTTPIDTDQGLCNLKHLQELDISNNNLSGNLPWCLANLTSLQRLSLDHNYFTGNVSLSPLKSLTSIQFLSLSDNQFQIPFSLAPFFNHSQLKTLNGKDNEIFADVEMHDDLTPKFQLEDLYLSANGNGYNGAFPKFLYYQRKLVHIYVSDVEIKGGFPNWLLENNTNLFSLILINNSLSGPFQLPNHSHMTLSILDISDNHFSGHIPTQIGGYLPGLTVLSMSGNGFNGSIPPSFGTLSFQVLDLANNNFSGSLPPSFSSSLTDVFLSKNELQGSLMDAFYNCSSLITLDLRHNFLAGSIPKWIDRFPELSFLLLGYNNLKGEIPIQLCTLGRLSLVDLSHNNFSGHILPCLRLSSRREELFGFICGRSICSYQESLEFTTKSISYSYEKSILQYFSGIDLSCNSLTGDIPPEIGKLNQIQVLNFSHNSLTGAIPQTFSNLSQIESLDLSYNNLNGNIPPQLVELYSLAVFSVAHNNLSGKTPKMVAQFSTFNKSSYEENPFLCGLPLPKRCTLEVSPPSMPRTSTNYEEDSGFMDMGVFYVSFLVSYIMMLLGMAAVLYINPCWRQAWFYYIEVGITSCYYFLVDNFSALSKFRGS